MGDADVQRAANHIAAALGEMGIPFVICGGLVVTAQGHARLTQGVDVILTGDYPGDGKPKPVRFPNPTTVAIDLGGAAMIVLPKLIELKLASSMTAPDRPRDLDDVIQLVRANALPRERGRLVSVTCQRSQETFCAPNWRDSCARGSVPSRYI